MNRDDLNARTMRFCVDVIKYLETVPKSNATMVIQRQLIRSSSSVAANYRAARRGRSPREYFAKLSIVVEEADESLFWLDLIKEAKLDTSNNLIRITQEATELLYIFSASRKTAKSRISLNHPISPNHQITK